MNKILCGSFTLLGIITIPFSLSFAELEERKPIQPFRSFVKEVPTVISFKQDLSPVSEEINEVLVTAILPDYPWVRVSDYRGFLSEKCVSCHRGISQVGKAHPLSFGCTVCHGGDGNSNNKEAAHLTLI